MTIAISTNTYHGFSLEDAVEGILRTNIRNIELLAVRGWTEHILPTMDSSRLAAIQDFLKEKGLATVALDGHASLLSDEGIASLHSSVALAERFGANWFVAELQQDCPRDDKRYPLMLERVKELAADCAKRSMCVAFETRGETYNTGKKVAEVLDEVGADNAYVNYDPANIVFCTGTDPYKDLEACADRIGVVHLKDQIGGIGVWNFPALGTGDIDIPRVLQGLPQNVLVSLDVEFTEKGPENLDAVHDALAQSCRYIEKLGY